MYHLLIPKPAAHPELERSRQSRGVPSRSSHSTDSISCRMVRGRQATILAPRTPFCLYLHHSGAGWIGENEPERQGRGTRVVFPFCLLPPGIHASWLPWGLWHFLLALLRSSFASFRALFLRSLARYSHQRWNNSTVIPPFDYTFRVCSNIIQTANNMQFTAALALAAAGFAAAQSSTTSSAATSSSTSTGSSGCGGAIDT